MSVLCKNCNNQVTIKTDKCPYCEKPLKAVSPKSSGSWRSFVVIPIIGIFGALFYFVGPKIQILLNQKSPDVANIAPAPTKTPVQSDASDAYFEMRKAADESDILTARKFLSKSKLELMSETDTAAIMEVLIPDIQMPNPSLVSEHKLGDKAVLVLKSTPDGFTDENGKPLDATGIIRMVQENGSWKMFDQVWHIHPPTDPLPEALEWLNRSPSAVTENDLPAGFEYDQDKCFEAIVKTEAKYVGWCLKTGMTPQTMWNDELTAFDFALLHMTGNEPGDVDILLAFLDAGVDVNKSVRGGMTPLMHAALSCRSDVVKAFISRGADPNLKGENGLDPVWASQNCPEVRQILTAN